MDLSPITCANNFLALAFTEGRTIQPIALEYLLWDVDRLHTERHDVRLMSQAFTLRDEGPVCFSIRHKTFVGSRPYRNEGLRSYLPTADGAKKIIDTSSVPHLGESIASAWSARKNLTLTEFHAAVCAPGGLFSKLLASGAMIH